MNEFPCVFHPLEAVLLLSLMAPALPLSHLLTRKRHPIGSRQVSQEVQSYMVSEEWVGQGAGWERARQGGSPGDGTQASAWLHSSTKLWKNSKAGLNLTHPLPSFEAGFTALCLVDTQ